MAGDPRAGLLLYCLARWQPYAQLTLPGDDEPWVAKTEAEWMAETGLSRNQYRRARAILKERGLIEVRVAWFRRVPTCHYRLAGGA